MSGAPQWLPARTRLWRWRPMRRATLDRRRSPSSNNDSGDMSHRISRVIATACGVGYAPKAPGTVASLLALLLWYWLQPSVWVQGIATVFVTLVGCWAAGDFAKQQRDPDPSCVVIDEVAGIWLDRHST